MQAHNVFCKKCGYHILMPNKRNIEEFAKADGVGHSLTPEGSCPRCGEVYNVNVPESFLRESQDEDEVDEGTKVELTNEEAENLGSESVDEDQDDSQGNEEPEVEPEANLDLDEDEVSPEESTHELGELGALGEVDDSDEDLNHDDEDDDVDLGDDLVAE